MSFKGFPILSSGGHFVQWRGMTLAILGTFLWNYFEISPLVSEGMSLKGFCIFSSGGHLVQRSRTILAILVEGHPSKFL